MHDVFWVLLLIVIVILIFLMLRIRIKIRIKIRIWGEGRGGLELGFLGGGGQYGVDEQMLLSDHSH